MPKRLAKLLFPGSWPDATRPRWCRPGARFQGQACSGIWCRPRLCRGPGRGAAHVWHAWRIGTPAPFKLGVYAGEFCADLGGVGVLEIVEDAEGLLPGLPGLQQLADGAADVAEVGEGVGFPPAVADGPEDAQRALIAGGRLAEVAGMVFGVAEAVPDVALQVAAAVVGVEGEGLPAKPACLGVVPQERVVPADRVEQFGLTGLVADTAEQAGGLLGVAERLGVLPSEFGERGQAVEAQGLDVAVAELLVQLGHVG